ncbi:hypothetical protein LJC05_00690 [Bacteroides sp. OttesenSCG-928-J23]|nr:hypothetical protein [Bacteroides sp. OttesenSCG-928-J23]
MNIRLFLLVVFAFIYLMAMPFVCAQLQEKKAIWDYPIKPGTEKWEKLENHAEMIEVCQIPNGILKSMITSDLITICLDYPLQTTFYANNNLQEGIKNVAAKFNGLQELFLRKDNAECLFEILKAKNTEKIVADGSLSILKRGEMIVRQSLVEALLSHELILANMSIEQQKDIATIAIRNMTIKEQKPEVYSKYSLESSAYHLCAILKKIDKNSFTPNMESFFKSGTLQNVTLLDELKQNYFKSITQ